MKPVRRVVMVLWDGFGSCFLRHLPKLPNLKRLADRSVRFPQCRTVYPTVTNVAWTAMMTGAYPEKTRNLAYYWDREDDVVYGLHRRYNLESIVEALARAGKTSASVGMFILLNHGLRWEHEGGEGRLYLQPDDGFDIRIDEAIRLLSGENGYVPDFLTVYTSMLDGLAHRVGPGHPNILVLLKHLDEHLGRLLDFLDAHPDRDETAVIFAADHGFSPAQISIRDDITQRLAASGYRITWLSTGESAPEDAEIVGVGPGRTASIYFVRRRTDPPRTFTAAEREEVRRILEETPHVDKVLGPDELKDLHTDTRLGDLVLEAEIPYAFWPRTTETLRGTHSSLAEQFVPCFLAVPGIPPAECTGGRTIDIIPTVAALLGAPPPKDAQGVPLLPR